MLVSPDRKKSEKNEIYGNAASGSISFAMKLMSANHCDYIHYNPVQHKLCESPQQWAISAYSSFYPAADLSVRLGGSGEVQLALLYLGCLRLCALLGDNATYGRDAAYFYGKDVIVLLFLSGRFSNNKKILFFDNIALATLSTGIAFAFKVSSE